MSAQEIMMRESGRAERRKDVARLKKNRKTYWGYPRLSYEDAPRPREPMDERALGKVVQYPASCSCAGCCNSRRAPNMNGGERTRDELRGFANYREQLQEVSDEDEEAQEASDA
jgi:hypothetical protein